MPDNCLNGPTPSAAGAVRGFPVPPAWLLPAGANHSGVTVLLPRPKQKGKGIPLGREVEEITGRTENGGVAACEGNE